MTFCCAPGKKKMHCSYLYAEVYAHNKASMRVLHNNGFYLEGIRRKSTVKNNMLLDDYVWVKILEK
jgi:ribosomal-protein-alanine N-acetyltransferase